MGGMATNNQTQSPVAYRRIWLALWIATVGMLVAILAVLTVVIEDNPESSLDFKALNWIAGWDAPGLVGLFEFVSFMTNNIPGLLMALFAVGFLWLLGLSREAKALFVIWMTLGLVVYMGDATYGEWVGRGRPFDSINDHPSYPSGHVFGSTVMFGFWLFIAGYYGLKPKFLLVGAVLLVGFLLLVGASRVHVQEHWPSDVVAGYLLGALWLLVLIPFFVYLRKASWFFNPNLAEDPTVVACETCRVEKSIANVVVLNPEEGTTTKVYNPPPLVNLMYWIAVQAKFPYTGNAAALEAAVYRRKIGGLLTQHRFGKNLVSPAKSANCDHGNCSFVTEYVPGNKVANDASAQKFLGEVAELFAEAGLGVWQINPRNPHAHTNLILTPEGDYKIIDLESAIVTVMPAKGQLRSALRSGNIPIFDDIDFTRLNAYINTHEEALKASLGTQGLAEFREVSGQGELLIREWKESEPRIAGRVISKLYRFLNLKGAAQHVMRAIQGADAIAIDFLKAGPRSMEKRGHH
jgi:undecaprenyl-diphosphatase